MVTHEEFHYIKAINLKDTYFFDFLLKPNINLIQYSTPLSK